MITESVFAKGKLDIKLLDPAGSLKDTRHVDNIVVATGKDLIAARLSGNTLAIPSHMAVGNSNTAASVSQTQLGEELARVSLDSTSRTNNALQYVATFGAGVGTGSLEEAGIFNAVSTGNMLCRTVFSPVNKAAGDTVVITWNITIL